MQAKQKQKIAEDSSSSDDDHDKKKETKGMQERAKSAQAIAAIQEAIKGSRKRNPSMDKEEDEKQTKKKKKKKSTR